VIAFADLLDRIVAPEHPHEPALVRANGRIAFTRDALAERVRACAGAFARAGIEAGTPVAFGIRQDADGIAWLLGAMRAGVTVVVLDPGLAPGALADRCRVAGVRATVTDGAVATVAHNGVLRSLAARRGLALPDPGSIAPVHWSTSRALGPVSRLDRLAGGDARRPLAPDAPALVLFTSGTTGAPRGVVHAPAGLAATLTMAAGLVELGRGDRVLGTGLHLIGPALLAGATVVVPPTNPSVNGLADVTRRLGVSHVTLPLHKALAWSAAGGAARQLRALWLGSAPVRNHGLRELAARLPGVELATAYGMTEHLLVATIGGADRLAHDEGEGDLVGRPVDGVRIRVAEDGEVHVGGPALALGYLGEPIPAGELPTGDLGRLDGAGRLVLLGRRKEMLIRDGENIYPGLYEPALAEAAGLAAAMMVGLPGADGDETVVLFAVPRGGEDPESARARLAILVASSESPLDRHARPDVVLGIAELPRAGRSGKPDRLGLARVAAQRLGRTLADDPALPVAG
jgi:acyl-CoA synthetase (AMP-forming)/AMP-acid ligase II